MAHAPRMRVIIDNDFSGDPDGLFQLAHHLLSPSVDVRMVLGSHLRPNDGFATSDTTADDAAAIATRIADAADRSDVRIIAGSNAPMTDASTPQDSPAARAIIEEAMRDDPLPLVACFGGALTAIASAILLEPRVADRLLLVWIGGAEYPGLAAPPPQPMAVEYNMLADVAAARTVFNDSSVPLWQVPRDAYRQTLMSQAELDRRVRSQGALGALLAESIDTIRDLLAGFGRPLGETYAYGDSPLVLLTALQSEFEPDPSSSRSVVRARPHVHEDGSLDFEAGGADARVFTRLDVRLMLEDLFAKLEAHAAGA